MNLRRYIGVGLRTWGVRSYAKLIKKESTTEAVCDRLVKHLRISRSEAEYISLKRPVVTKLSDDNLEEMINSIVDLGLPKRVLIQEPVLFGILPVTLRLRYKVLQECGFQNITAYHLVSYLTIMKQKSIGDLKKSKDIPHFINIENTIATCMSQWPTSLTTLIEDDINNYTLYSLRLKIIQRYLELTLDVTQEEFDKGLHTYPTIRHRPLRFINETLTILKSVILMPTNKIKNNLYLIHADPENLKEIVYKFRSIGGMDIKDVIRMHPRIAMRSYSTLLEIRKVITEYGFNDEAQIRCFDIYTLSPETIRERIEKAKNVPEFSTLFHHPRFLRVIYYNKNAVKRLLKLQSFNKRCVSLNILAGSLAHYESYEKAPGDRLGKSKDLVFCISQLLGKGFSMADVRKAVKRHPFWVNIPLVQVKHVYEQLVSLKFTPEEIYANCPILLYPWNKMKSVLCCMNGQNPLLEFNNFNIGNECLHLEQLSNTQKLSVILYLLEKNHYFSGNGVWSEEIISVNNNRLGGSTSTPLDINVSPKTKMIALQ